MFIINEGVAQLDLKKIINYKKYYNTEHKKTLEKYLNFSKVLSVLIAVHKLRFRIIFNVKISTLVLLVHMNYVA